MVKAWVFHNWVVMIGLLVVTVMACEHSYKKSEKFILVAHRGGVVDDTLSENSLKGLEEAIRRGYTHVEVDARVTKDGHVVCYHDENLMREAGVDKNISDLTIAELKQIKLTKSQEPVPTFREYCARCAGRIDLMIDTKGVSDTYLEQYAREIEAALTEYGLLKNALFIVNRMPIRNQDKVADWFLGKSLTAWRMDLIKAQILAGSLPNPGKYHFIFNSPKDFTEEMIEGFHKLGLLVIPSVNIDHYKTGDPLQQGLADIEKMLDWGVDGLQIDSCYDPLVFSIIRKN